MGEVYRARDTRLDRSVAVKVLPLHLLADSDARARFEREARAISALNHPNICTLHDVGNEDGMTYLVMELLEGESLAALLARGRLPLDRALRYGIEIARALDRAHGQGIIHRDLKPANIMITRTGVKLVDFGLARQSLSASRASDAPTAVSPITAEGTILGTLQYMSPEQLEGKITDERTDIFSLGCILYEMVTGRRAFDGTSQVSVITAIMGEEPPPIASLVPLSPSSFERLVRKCLVKNADDRWRSAGDVATELEWIRDGVDSPVPKATSRGSRLPWFVTGASLLLAAAVVVATLMRKAPAPDAPLRATIPIAADALDPTILRDDVVVSPDGRSLIYIAIKDGKRSLWLRKLDSMESVALPHTENVSMAMWSPDATQIAFATGSMASGSRLQRMPIEGGEPIVICELNAGAYYSGTWGEDGTILISQLSNVSANYLTRVSSGGGPVAEIKIGPDKVIYPHFVDHDHFLYCTFVKGADLQLHLRSLASGEDRDLGPIDSRAEVVGDTLLFVRSGSLCGQRIGKDLKRLGEPVVLAPDVEFFGTLGGAEFSASERTIAFYPSFPQGTLTRFDREGRLLGTVGPPALTGSFRVSHDGRRVVVSMRDSEHGTGDLGVVDIARNSVARITKTRPSEGSPVWSPDDRTLAFSYEGDGPPHVYMMPAAGGDPVMVTKPRGVEYVYDWLPNGKIVFSELSSTTRRDIWLVDSKAGSEPEPWLKTPFNEAIPRASPDGKWIAFISNSSGQAQVHVAPYDRPADAVQVSSEGNPAAIVWSRDGRELFWATADSRLYGATIRREPAFDAGKPVLLFHDAAARWDCIDIMPGTNDFLIGRISEQRREIHVIQNWRSLLGK